MIICSLQFAFYEGWELLEFDQGRSLAGVVRRVNVGVELFNRDWFCSLLSLVAVSSHVADDTTVAAGTSEFRFAISECLNEFYPCLLCRLFLLESSCSEVPFSPLPALSLFMPLPRPPFLVEGLSWRLRSFLQSAVV